MRTFGAALLSLLLPAIAWGQDFCSTDDECAPSGRRCIDGQCGVCGMGETRDCDEGCGPGTATCNYDIRWWGPCAVNDPGSLECDPNADEPPTQECEHVCPGIDGYHACDPTSCTWESDCLNDQGQPIECLPGNTAVCTTLRTQCPGTKTCGDECSWGECDPDPTVCNCAGGDPCCGNGALDPGEECDTEPHCGTTCRWTEARDFQSCDCRVPGAGTSPEPALAMGVLAVAILAARKRRT